MINLNQSFLAGLIHKPPLPGIAPAVPVEVDSFTGAPVPATAITAPDEGGFENIVAKWGHGPLPFLRKVKPLHCDSQFLERRLAELEPSEFLKNLFSLMQNEFETGLQNAVSILLVLLSAPNAQRAWAKHILDQTYGCRGVATFDPVNMEAKEFFLCVLVVLKELFPHILTDEVFAITVLNTVAKANFSAGTGMNSVPSIGLTHWDGFDERHRLYFLIGAAHELGHNINKFYLDPLANRQNYVDGFCFDECLSTLWGFALVDFLGIDNSMGHDLVPYEQHIAELRIQDGVTDGMIERGWSFTAWLKKIGYRPNRHQARDVLKAVYDILIGYGRDKTTRVSDQRFIRDIRKKLV